MHKKSRMILASLAAFAMIAPTASGFAAPLTASAGEVCGESSFDYKALPWHTCESSPAKQNFWIEDGAFHIKILESTGAESQQWDLQFRHRNLNFKSGHTYKISFKAKSSHNGLKINSKIGQPNSPYEEYCDLVETEFVNGPHMGNSNGWGKPGTLSTEWKTFEGTFECSKDLEGMEWAFHFANGEKGNAEDGDELWFDDMHIDCQNCSTFSSNSCVADPNAHYGAISRSYSGLENNYISVNQLGYLPNYAKIATLGDNGGDIMHGADKISLSGSYDFEVVSSSGTVVYTGKTTTVKHDAQSDDDTCKLDFSEVTTPGKYYLRIKGKEWRSFEFEIADDIYSRKGEHSNGDLLTNSINYFYQNRSGVDIESSYVVSGTESALAHQGGHKTDTASVQKIWKNEYTDKSQATGTYASSTITANGGWYDAGDHGKYVVNGGISVWTLQNMYERAIMTDAGKKKFADGSGTVVIPEQSNGNPDILDECKFELDFMDQMVVKSSEPTWGDKAGMVYHKLHDHKWTGLATKPWDYDGPKEQGGWETVRIVKPPTFAATLNYAACAAQAARLWKEYDSSYSAKLLEAAKTCYKAAQDNFYEADHTKTTHPDLNCPCEKEEINEKSLYAPMWQAKGGGPYGDNEVKDDFYWAACELYTTTKALGDSSADTYLSDLSGYKVGGKDMAFKVTTRITGGENASGEGSFTTYNWGNTASAGSMTLLLHPEYLTDSQKSTLKASVLEAADEYIKCEEEEGYGIPYKYDGPGYNDPNNLDPEIIIKGYEWGSNSMVINNLSVMAYAYDLTNEKKYMDGVVTGMNYLLGNNPLAFSFITGYGTYHEVNPHHRYWSHELDKTLPNAPDGILSGGPNAGLQDPYVRALGFVPGKSDNPSQRCFVDSIEAWSTNEVTINWNAPLAWITQYLQDGRIDIWDDIPPISNESTTTTTSSDPGSTPLYGDVDCSGDVKIADAVLLARYVAEDQVTVTTQGKLNADCFADGKGALDSNDLSSLLKFLANSNVTLPEK
ncbi:MAG: glycoside hydrolase family 9 protein [Oscillospiraceae bacterium]|nr:glycoside hydrolase family 9 protein [Oscillospiraceae bacterium]